MQLMFSDDDRAALADLIVEKWAAAAPETPRPYLDVDQAAKYLACGRRRIYQLVKAERLTAHRDGKRLLFTYADLDAALDREAAT